MLPKQIDIEGNLGFGGVQKSEFGQVFQVQGVFGGVASRRQVKGFKNMIRRMKIASTENRRYPTLSTHQFAKTLGTQLEAWI